jgi:GT2 family glycosyltransferase
MNSTTEVRKVLVPKNVVVICTRNRSEELKKILTSIDQQTMFPDLVLVIDSSDSFFQLQNNYGFKLNHVPSKKNLTFQRNVSLGMLSTLNKDARIHFFDDDVILGNQYIEKVSKRFDSYPDIDGICARTPDNTDKNPSVYMRIFLLDSIRSGRILPSGVNVAFKNSSDSYEVEWLAGCCMSYRLNKIRELRFDESRKGVGWGEDVDFSYRLSRSCKLMCMTDLEITHSLSLTNRDSTIIQYFRAIENRFKLVRVPQGKVRGVFVLWSLLGEIPLLLSLKVKRTIQALNKPK